MEWFPGHDLAALDTQAAMEATLGWYWAADVLAECGARLHLAHPLGIKAFAYQRVKKDESDARLLAELRMGPPEARELRELALPPQAGGGPGQRQGPGARRAGQAGRQGPGVGPVRVESLRDLVSMTARSPCWTASSPGLAGHPGYEAIQAIPGVGKVLAAVFVAEIGDVSRFARPELASWAGMTPRHRESDTTVRRGRITKPGSRLVRWAAVEAAMLPRSSSWLKSDYRRIAARRPELMRTGGPSIAAQNVSARIRGVGLPEWQHR